MTIFEIYKNELSKYPVLTPQEERDLFVEYNKNHDEKIRNKIILHNLRYVFSVACKFKNSNRDVNDLISAGNIGLIKAIDVFDVNVGTRFLTIATSYIKKEIYDCIRNQKLIYMYPVLFNMAESDEFKECNSIDEICEKFNISKDVAFGVLRFSQGVVSLDSVCEDMNGKEHTLIENVAYDTTELEEKKELEEKRQKLNERFSVLNDYDKELLYKRLGMGGFEAYVLDDIAEEEGLSREGARQKQVNAIKHLREKDAELADAVSSVLNINRKK